MRGINICNGIENKYIYILYGPQKVPKFFTPFFRTRLRWGQQGLRNIIVIDYISDKGSFTGSNWVGCVQEAYINNSLLDMINLAKADSLA